MLIANETQRKQREIDLKEQGQKQAAKQRQDAKNSNFTQVYPLGWRRLRELFKRNPGAAELYSMLAEHIDGACGAVVADQSHLAAMMGVSRQTISKYIKFLEAEMVLVKIPIAGKVCAYALNPYEVWRGYDTTKEHAAFLTKTLVNKDGDIQRRIMAMFHDNDAREGMEGDKPEVE